MKTVAQVLASKGNQVHSLSSDTPLLSALECMATHNIGALMIVNRGSLVGIFSERDLARQIVNESRPLSEMVVGELMTTRVAYVEPKRTIEECMALMTDKRIRHLPVMEGGQLVGIISIGDIVKAMIDEKEFLIAQLENYITGR